MPHFGVIFDMDGVLVDSYQAHFASWQRAAAHYGVTMSEAQFARTFGQTNAMLIPDLWGDAIRPDQVQAFADTKEATYREILDQDFPAMDGAGDLIRALYDTGFALAIGSSAPPENVACAMRGLPNAECFKTSVCGDDVSQGKPHPEVFLKAAERLGIEPENCAVIEDSLPGLEAAKRAGMLAIALTGTTDPAALQEKADLVVGSLRKLSPERITAMITADIR